MYVIQMLQTLKNAGYQLAVDGTNAYALPYADRIYNLPVESSHTRLETYDVPFVAMVLHGYIPMYAEPINSGSNYQKAILQAIESGAGISYQLMSSENSLLFQTDYTDYMSLSQQIWMEEIQTTIQSVLHRVSGLGNQRIVFHEQLKEDLVRITYENGTQIILNYSQQAQEFDNMTINSMDFVVSHEHGQ